MRIEMEGRMAPKFYGATTIGERGQAVIPAEARMDLDLTPSTKLLVFGSQDKGDIMITKAESFTEFLTKAIGMLSCFEGVLRADIEPKGEEEVKEKGKTGDI